MVARHSPQKAGASTFWNHLGRQTKAIPQSQGPGEPLNAIPDIICWFWGLGRVAPQLFSEEKLRDLLDKSMDVNDGSRVEPKTLHRHLLYLASAYLWESANSCRLCPNHLNRNPVGPVLHDGSSAPHREQSLEIQRHLKTGSRLIPLPRMGADIMIVGEGPGQYEQRTGVPFCSDASIAGSPCAEICAKYEACFPPRTGTPRQPCRPTKLQDSSLVEIRAKADPLKIYTAGNFLDDLLIKAGLVRESWNNMRVSRGLTPKAGTVQIVNIIKCRSAEPHEGSIDGLRDKTPSPQDIESCSVFLRAQLYLLRPRILVTLGAPAFQFLSGTDTGIGKSRDKLHLSRYGVPMLADYHPAYIMRQDQERQPPLLAGLLETLRRAKHLCGADSDELSILTSTTNKASHPSTEYREELDITIPYSPEVQASLEALWRSLEDGS